MLSSELFLIMSTTTCEVCWSCRGLECLNTEEKLKSMNDHVLTCSGVGDDFNLKDFNYYVCDRDEYSALINFKKFLTLCGDTALKLYKILPPEILNPLMPKRKSLNKCKYQKEASDRHGVSLSHDLFDSEKKTLKSQCILSFKGNATHFNCKLCGHESKHEKLMLRHLNSHNDGEAFKCSRCDFSTLWKMKWNQHLQTCKQPSELLCHMCGISFTKDAKLTKHLSEHSVTDKLKCNDCDYIGKSKALLQDHKKKHTGELHSCPLDGCNFKSIYQRALNNHLTKKHAQEKSYLCSLCGFRTRHLSSLAKHQLSHQRIKRFKCSECSVTAHTSSQIVSHAIRKHAKQKMFSCPKCSFKTNYDLSIKNHIQRHGMVELSCSVCGEFLPNMRKAKQHMTVGHGCKDYNIISNNIGIVEAKDFKVKNYKDLCEDPSKYVIEMSEEEAKSKMAAINTKLMDVDVLELATNILASEAHAGKLSEDLLSPSLQTGSAAIHQSSDMFVTEAETSSKERNPMLSAISQDLGDDENSLNSLFDLMTDFPRPPNPNRCQSASTLMFTSFSPHLVDRPLTPDFFSDSPSAGSFFPQLGTKSLPEGEGLPISNLSSFESQQSYSISSSQTTLLVPPMGSKRSTPQSPLLTGFVSSPLPGSANSLHSVVNMNAALMQASQCENIDSLLSNSIFSNNAPSQKAQALTFQTRNSAFTSVSNDFSSDLQIQAAVASITSSQDISDSNAVEGTATPFSSDTTM